MSLGKRIGRLERGAGLNAAAVREAEDRIASEAIKRVSDEDLDVMAEMLERMPGALGEEAASALHEEFPEVWRRYEEIWRAVAEEMARER